MKSPVPFLIIFLIVSSYSLKSHLSQFIKCGTYICPQYLEKPSSILNSDPNTYMAYTLPNNLKFLLIIDPTKKSMSDFQLSVRVGSYFNPQKFAGLAHLLEHMIFLGSQKYQQSNGYQQFLKNNSGSSNAQTSQDQTKYYFTVSYDGLVEAIDRLVSGIFKPLLLSQSIEKQINAVDQQYQLSLNRPDWENYMVFKHQFGNNKFSKYTGGNKKTLNYSGEILSEELKKFHSQYYSSDIMVAGACVSHFNATIIQEILVILSQLKDKSISQDVQFIDAIFKAKQNSRITINHTMPYHHSASIISIPFIKETGKMMIKDQGNILDYYHNIIDRQGGVISHIIKKYPSLISISANAQYQFGYVFPSLNLDFELQPKEDFADESPTMVEQIYQIFVKELNSIKINKNCLKKVQEELDLEYDLGKYKGSNSLSYLSSLITSWQYYPAKTLLRRDFQIKDQGFEIQWKCVIIQRKSNACPIRGQIDRYHEEPNFHTYYIVQSVSNVLTEEQLNEIMPDNPNKCFSNKYSALIKVPQDKNETISKDNPKWVSKNIIYSPAISSFKYTTSISLVAHYQSKFSPIFISTFHQFLATDLQLSRQSNLAARVLRGISYSTSHDSTSLGAELIGPLQPIKMLLGHYLQKIRRKDIPTQFQFNRNIMKFKQSIWDYYLDNKPWGIGGQVLSHLFILSSKLIEGVREDVDKYTYKQFVDQWKQFQNTLRISWGIVCLESIKQQSIQYIQKLQSQWFNISNNDLPIKPWIRQTVQCNQGVINIDVNRQSPTFIQYYHPVGPKTIKNWVIINLLYQATNEAFFNALRTQKKLAYALFLEPTQIPTQKSGISFFLVSTKISSKEITKQVQQFITQFYKNPISEKDFNSIKNVVKTILTQPFQSCQGVSKFIFKNLMSQYYTQPQRIYWLDKYSTQIDNINIEQYNSLVNAVKSLKNNIIIQFSPQSKSVKDQTDYSFQRFKQKQCKNVNIE